MALAQHWNLPDKCAKALPWHRAESSPLQHAVAMPTAMHHLYSSRHAVKTARWNARLDLGCRLIRAAAAVPTKTADAIKRRYAALEVGIKPGSTHTLLQVPIAVP